MQRLIMNDLIAWKQSKRRKPLVLRGARQVGKSWILEEFGKTFPNGFVKINFDREPEFAQFFQTTKDVRRILQNLSMATGKAITTDTLIIFDEIQACEEALNSLKYFKEDAPEYYVASAGSLLGLQLSSGFPVGQVDFLEMGPMTFTEFLLADGSENYVQYLSSINEPEAIPDAFFSPFHAGRFDRFPRFCLNRNNIVLTLNNEINLMRRFSPIARRYFKAANQRLINKVFSQCPFKFCKQPHLFCKSCCR